MQDVYTLVGIVAVCLIAGGVFFYGVGFLKAQAHESYYNGLRCQIADTVAQISKVYEPGELMSQDACRKILTILNERCWPDIAFIKSNDEMSQKTRGD